LNDSTRAKGKIHIHIYKGKKEREKKMGKQNAGDTDVGETQAGQPIYFYFIEACLRFLLDFSRIYMRHSGVSNILAFFPCARKALNISPCMCIIYAYKRRAKNNKMEIKNVFILLIFTHGPTETIAQQL